MADDIRKVATKRTRVFLLKLTDEEVTGLQWLAERDFRRPGDELRHLLNEAITRQRAGTKD
jgi:hypothetical protein